MIELSEETQIEIGDLIHNPRENVRYLVSSYTYDLDFETQVAYLKPVKPFGLSKKDFSIPIKSMIDMKYKLIRQKKD
nr:hypothetical protein [uncultured Flavobacterium sp.]